jgi:hypothetical protein
MNLTLMEVRFHSAGLSSGPEENSYIKEHKRSYVGEATCRLHGIKTKKPVPKRV